jgi:hypothetical protein
VRLRAVGIALVVVAVSGCAGPTRSARPSATDGSTVEPHEIDYMVSLNPANEYFTLDLRYSDPHGGSTNDTWPAPVWKEHIQTKKGVSHIYLAAGAVSNGQQPPAGVPFELPTVQCTILVDGVQATTHSSTIAAQCIVDLNHWKPSQAPVGGKVSESPTA